MLASGVKESERESITFCRQLSSNDFFEESAHLVTLEHDEEQFSTLFLLYHCSLSAPPNSLALHQLYTVILSPRKVKQPKLVDVERNLVILSF